MKIKMKRFDKELPPPKAKPYTAGFDLYCRINVAIPPHKIGLVPLNTAMEIPEGYVVLLICRSSTPAKKGVTLANGIGVWDPFYRGDKEEALAPFYNLLDKEVLVEKGDKLVQGVLVRYEVPIFTEVRELGESDIGEWKAGDENDWVVDSRDS